MGIEVKEQKDGIFISQESYAKEILQKFKMNDYNPISTPMECRVKLSKYDEREEEDPIFFKSLVGSLRYLTCTRLDILYVVGLVSQYMGNPKITHFKAAKKSFTILKVQLISAYYTHFLITISVLDIVTVVGVEM